VAGLTLQEACRLTAGNVGNLVWMEGAAAMLSDPMSHRFIRSSFGDKKLDMYGAKAFVFPVANILANRSLCDQPIAVHHFNMMENTLRAVRSVEGPTLLIGVGTQAYFGVEHKAEAVYYDLQPGSIQATPQSYRLCQLDQDMLRVVQERHGAVLARGAFTAQVLRAHGFDHVVSAGCPSLLSNRKPGLGRQIQARWEDLKRRLQAGSLDRRHVRVAVNLPPYFKPKLLRLFLQILRANPNNRLVLQDQRDEKTLQEAEEELRLTVSERQKTFFTSVAAWTEFMSHFDFVLGGRIHGTMMGVHAYTPGFIIAPDWRVLEMAEAMLIPVANVFDRRLQGKDVTVADLIDMATWDGLAFDRNRCVIYQQYLQIFQGARLELHPELARLCVDFPGLTAPQGQGSS
jgi:hypothetical protein